MLGYRPPAGSLRGKKNKSNYKFDEADTAAIIKWANIHLMVRWIEYDQGSLRKLKKDLIRRFTPLMNIDHNPQKSVELEALRRECLEIARS